MQTKNIDIASVTDSGERFKTKKLKFLIISENSHEIFMVKRYCPKEEGYTILEASTLPQALKIASYVSLDLVIVDDRLEGLSLDEALGKLLSISSLQYTPKLLLLTDEFKDIKIPKYSKNIEFLKKPLTKEIFLHRANLLIQNMQHSANQSYFKHNFYHKMSEASSLMDVYYDIFEHDESMMLIYDDMSRSFLEVNSAFEKFFSNVLLLNRIFFNKKVAREFVPYMDEDSYLNYYNPDEWISKAIQNCEFDIPTNIKIHLSCREYSFNLIIRELNFDNRSIYLIKMINIYDFFPKNEGKKSADLQLKESNLYSFKDEFLKLRELLKRQKVKKSDDIDKLIYHLSSKLSILCDDNSIIEELNLNNKLDLYNYIVELLKEHSDKRAITLNSKLITNKYDCDLGKIYLDLNKDEVKDLVSAILESMRSDIDILLYESNSMAIVEFSSKDVELDELELQTLLSPYLRRLNANIEIVKEQTSVIVVVNIPK